MADTTQGPKLATAELLQDVPVETIAKLESRVTWQEFAAEQEVFSRESDPPYEVYFVSQGLVRVVNFSPTGREIAFADLGPGAIFGELSAIDGKSRSAAVVSMKESTLALIPQDAFIDMLMEQPVVAVRLLRRFANIIRSADDRIVTLSTLTDVQRVYGELLRIAEPDPIGDGTWMIEPMPFHKEIASWAGTSSEVVARAVGQLSKVGIVRRRNMALHILDRERLQTLANLG